MAMTEVRGDLLGKPLDARDLEVLRWIAQGFSHEGVRNAAQFSSQEKAKYYSQRLYKKLGASNAAHAVFLGIQAGWLDPATGQPNIHAVPAIAADLVRARVVEALDEAREKMAKEIQEQLNAFASQFVITITERGA